MSKESLKKFVKDSGENKELQDILTKGVEIGDSSRAQIEYVVKEARNRGYDFTVAEFLDLFKSSDSKSGEIMDDDLANVAGGTGPIYDFCIRVKRGIEDLIDGPPSLGKRLTRKAHDIENNLSKKWYKNI